MELHPDLKKRWERIEQAHDALFEQLKYKCVPFWWHGDRQANGVILHNGTICVVDTGELVIGVTAHHVYKKYQEERATDKTFVCQFGDLTVAPEELLIDEDERLDLVTFDLSPIIGAQQRFVPSKWPPKRPEPGDLVMFGGSPGTPRTVNLETDTATFSLDTVTALVTGVGYDGILIRVNYSKLMRLAP
jgi:hypothetical protein